MHIRKWSAHYFQDDSLSITSIMGDLPSLVGMLGISGDYFLKYANLGDIFSFFLHISKKSSNFAATNTNNCTQYYKYYVSTCSK